MSDYPIPRRWPRHKIDVPVAVISHGPIRATAIQGLGSELNCGGMTVFIGNELSIGDQVSLEFTPPRSGSPVAVRCFVRNGHSGRYGVEFITENDADYRSIGHLESVLKTLAASPPSR